MASPAIAFVVHRLPGRVRIKFPAARGNRSWLDALAERLGDCPAVAAVQTNPATGSLLIELAAASQLEAVLAYAEDEGLFRCGEGEPPSALPDPPASLSALAAKGVDLVNRGVQAGSLGRMDLPSVYFLAFLGMGVLELRRGHVMPPAVTLFWRALEVLRKR